MLDCLSNLIGLTGKDCECFSASEPIGFDALNESESGYYITDDDYGFPLIESVYAGIDCGDPNNIYNVLAKARASAIGSIYTDLQAALKMHHDKAVDSFSGLVGQRRANGYGVFGNTATMAGQLWQPKAIRDAYFVVTHVWVGVSAAGNLAFSIRSNAPDFTTVNQTFNVTTPGVFQKFALTTPVKLPFFSKYVDYGGHFDCGLRYTFSYPILAGLKPLANVYSCCGNSNTGWKKQMTAGGFETSDINATLNDCGLICNGSAQGLAIEGYTECNGLDWLCSLEEMNGKDLRDVLARTMQYSAASYLCQHILDSTNINFWTTLNRESLYGKRNHAKKRYGELITWMAENLPNNVTGCYKCKPGRIQRRTF